MNTLDIIFWDVQHGHATYIKTPNNRHIVIDLGTGDYSGKNIEFSPLRHLKYKGGVDKLDKVVITHPHLDHIDDILNFDLLKPASILRPTAVTNAMLMKRLEENKMTNQSDREKFEKYCEINSRYSYPVSPNNSFSNSDYWGGVIIRTFLDGNYNGTNINNYSIITVFEYLGIKIVIPGDNEKSSLEVHLKNPKFVNAVKNSYILLAPHHGRDSGYLSDFVKLVNPKISVVSDGRFCDTSANDCYSKLSTGWKVSSKSNNSSEKRYCLTTNSDGEIYVKIGKQSDSSKFLQIQKS